MERLQHHPVPKVTPITSREDLRPIVLTTVVSKLLEDFVVEWLIEDVKLIIDPSQFGCLKGTSTTYCLLDDTQLAILHQ